MNSMQTPGPSLRLDYLDPLRGYDVIVLGGGPAGCATALALRQHGVSSILVVESSRYDVSPIGESVPPDTRIVLEQLGIWEAFLNEKHESCLGSCSSWGANRLGYNDFLFNPYGNGWHLDRSRFDSFLARKAEGCGAEVCAGTRFVAGERTGSEGFRLRLAEDNGQTKTVRAKFVVDATGWHASFAAQMGASKIFLDRLICVSAFFHLPASAHFSRLTMLEAVEYGWWYAARLPNDQLAVAVACDPEFMRRAALNKSENWCSHLRETAHLSRELAGCVFVEDSLRVCTAPSFLLDNAAGHSWLAVGDAASSYDPISSQGIFKALSDGLKAAEVIAAFLRGGADRTGDYQASVARRFDDYLANRNYFYGVEKRWADASFWKTRVERASL
jgi:flavin-dependent dehydrogenase